MVGPGDVIAGKYRVERLLGSGGMGIVVAARHSELDERVAIKLLRSEVAATAGEVSVRFAREGRAAAKIRSEHVARILDVGTLDGGVPFLVMEYLEGQDLSTHLEEQGPLPVADAVDYILQICEALAEAHTIGIIHRDLKPANLFLTKRADGSPCVKLLDFGISKMGTLPEDKAITHANTLMGSPWYMSPEQLNSPRDVDSRSDVWGIGVTLYQLLTGRVPFDGSTMPELITKVVTRSPDSVAKLRAEVPAGLDDVVRKCLEKNPHDRFTDVAELSFALEPFAPRRSRMSVERIARVIGRPVAPSPSMAPRPARTWPLYVAVGTAVIALANGAFLVLHARRSPEVTHVAPPSPPSVQESTGAPSSAPPVADPPTQLTPLSSSSTTPAPTSPAPTGPPVRPASRTPVKRPPAVPDDRL
jgi:serine/threonine-protein kinase